MTETPTTPDITLSPTIEGMVKAGVLYGATKTKTHPKMKPFVATLRNGIGIIDLEKTSVQLDATLAVLQEKMKMRIPIILVGTQPAAQEDIEAIGKEFNLPYVSVRWLGGTLTNYDIISARIEYYKKLKSDWMSGEFEKYTKKERLDIERAIAKFKITLEGLEPMTERPKLMVLIDPATHKSTLNEARRTGMPVVALMNTDMDPAKVEFPVVGNTRAKSSIQWFLGNVREALRRGKEAQGQAVLPKEELKEKSEAA